MSFEIPKFRLGVLKANADLSAKQFFGVKLVNSGGVAAIALAGAGEAAIGLLQNKPEAGQVCEVGVDGVEQGIAGAAITAGAPVTTDADGKLVTATAGYTKTDDAGAAQDALVGSNILGYALASAAGADEVIPVLMVKRGVAPTTAA